MKILFKSIFLGLITAQAAFAGEPDFQALEASLPKLVHLSRSVKDKATQKNVQEVIDYVQQVLQAKDKRDSKTFKQAANAVMHATKKLVYEKEKRQGDSSSSSSSSSSSCNACDKLSELDSEIKYCSKTIQDELQNLLGLLNTQSPCDMPQSINSVPIVIQEPGKYCVTADLIYNGADAAITVTASNVSINFHNHSLVLNNPLAVGLLVLGSDSQNVTEFTLENDVIMGVSPFSSPTSAAIVLEYVDKAAINNVYTLNTTKGIKLVNATDVAIDNSLFSAHVGTASINIQTEGAGVWVEASNGVAISGCSFEGSTQAPTNSSASNGLYIGSQSSNVSCVNSNFQNWLVSINANQVTDLLVENVLAQASSYSQEALALFGGKGVAEVANDIIIRNSSFEQKTSQPGFDGLRFIQGSNCLLENLIVDTASTDVAGNYYPAAIHIGCNVNGGCAPALQFNDIAATNLLVTGTNDYSLYIESGSNMRFVKSQFSDATRANVFFDAAASHVIVADCTIVNATGENGSGVSLETGATTNAVVNCDITDNALYGIFVAPGATYSHLRGNSVNGNSVGILNDESTTETYNNRSCHNTTYDCRAVSPSQLPSDAVVVGSNICCTNG